MIKETLYGLGEPDTTCLEDSGSHLLLTLDGSAEAATAIEPAIELARRKMGATLHLLRVVVLTISEVYGEIDRISYDQTPDRN